MVTLKVKNNMSNLDCFDKFFPYDFLSFTMRGWFMKRCWVSGSNFFFCLRYDSLLSGKYSFPSHLFIQQTTAQCCVLATGSIPTFQKFNLKRSLTDKMNYELQEGSRLWILQAEKNRSWSFSICWLLPQLLRQSEPWFLNLQSKNGKVQVSGFSAFNELISAS